MANVKYGVNIIPRTNNTYTIGNSDYKWANIYTVQLNGVNVEDLGTSDLATTTTPGLMSAADKAKLDTLSAFNATDYTVNIATTDWVNNSYTWTNAAVTATSYIIVNFTSSVNDYVKGMLDYTKVSGGVQFNVESTPTGTITLIVGIIDGASGTSVGGGGADIDDTTTALNKTWSSSKIDEQVIISSTQPSAVSNKLWISNDSGTEVTVPTYSEFTTLADSTITDVKMNGTSVVNNNIANIPMAATYQNAENPGTPGVVHPSSWYGTKIQDNVLAISGATISDVKTGTTTLRPLTPALEDCIAFYGLAKAASDTTQKASSNTIGIYTDEAKIAIQKMLGIYEPPFVLLNDITLEERTSVSLTADDNNTPYNLRNVFMEIKYPADLVSESSGYGRWQFHNSNSDFLNCETGRYTTNSVQCFKRIWSERKGNLILVYFSRQANTSGYGATYYKDTITNGRGAKFDFGNITAIKMNTNDYEPAGTQIKIWGQWAY